MTLIRPETGEETPGQVLEEVQEHFNRARQVFEEVIQRIKAGELVTASESDKAVSELNRAKQTLYNERAKIEEQLRRDAGVHNAYALDLGAARVEIRRRMACLRAAGEGGELSE